jgi:hypothetical protein
MPAQADLATYNKTLYNVTGAIIDPRYCNQTQTGGSRTRRAPALLLLLAAALAAAVAAL